MIKVIWRHCGYGRVGPLRTTHRNFFLHKPVVKGRGKYGLLLLLCYGGALRPRVDGGESLDLDAAAVPAMLLTEE